MVSHSPPPSCPQQMIFVRCHRDRCSMAKSVFSRRLQLRACRSNCDRLLLLVFSVFGCTGAAFAADAVHPSVACMPAGVFTGRDGLLVVLKPAAHDGGRGLIASSDSDGRNGNWSKGNGTIAEVGSRWCGCGAGGSCQSSRGLCRALTMRFFSHTDELVRTAIATVENDCSGIASWSDGAAAWWKPDSSVSSIHVVTMVHLDVGFTNSTRAVCDMYFDQHFPRAVETAKELRRRKSSAQFQWTTFPWLLQEFLDGASGCATRQRRPEEIAAVRKAIAQDDIIWHANALNSFLELYDAELLTYSAGLKDKLNSEFGKEHGTLCGKQTDVPGMSIAAVPVLARAGVKAMHIGYNGACKLPESLPPIFRWRHEGSATELLVMVEAGYGMLVRAGTVALAFMYVGDNGLPPTPDEVESYWGELEARFPLATLRASSLDAFTHHVLASPEIVSGLSVITDDVGDSWLYGAPADPIKLSVFREARRYTQASIAAKRLTPTNPHLLAYMRRLLKSAPEHNWGLSIGAFLPELRSISGNWSNVLFQHARATEPAYALFDREWQAQRAYNYPLTPAGQSLERGASTSTQLTLEWESFRKRLVKRLLRLEAGLLLPPFSTPGAPGNEGAAGARAARGRGPEAASPRQPPSRMLDIHQRVKAGGAGGVFKCGNVEIGFNASDGSVETLAVLPARLPKQVQRPGPGPDGAQIRAPAAAHNWADKIGFIQYQTFSEDDFRDFNAAYTPGCVPCDDFAKPGMRSADARSQVWNPSLSAAYLSLGSRPSSSAGEQCHFVLEVGFEEEARNKYGAPATVELHYIVPGSRGAALDVAMQWQNKSATRLAEAIWLSMDLRVPGAPVPFRSEVSPTTGGGGNEDGPETAAGQYDGGGEGGGGNRRARIRGRTATRLPSEATGDNFADNTMNAEAVYADEWREGEQRQTTAHAGAREYRWEMHVLGAWQSPYAFVVNGSRHIHAVQHGVRLRSSATHRETEDARQRPAVESNAVVHVEIASLDAPLLSFTDISHLLRYDGEVVAERPVAGKTSGVHFNLYNNVWGTAFPQWQSSDASFRFQVFLPALASQASLPTVLDDWVEDWEKDESQDASRSAVV